MSETAIDEFAWMDAEPVAAERPTRKRRKKKRERQKGSKVEAAVKLPLERLRGRAMFQSVNGRKRIWACDGEYVFFRRKSCYAKDPVTGVDVRNHVAIERHERFLREGHYTYVETQDDVEVCKVNENSPFHRKGQFLGEMSDGEVRRKVIGAACRRDWVLYTDALEEYAGRIKNRGYHPAFAANVWNDHLEYITRLVMMRQGPLPPECATGMQNVLKQRGRGRGQVILLPNRPIILPSDD